MRALRVLYLEAGSGAGGSSVSLVRLLTQLGGAAIDPQVIIHQAGTLKRQLDALGVPNRVLPLRPTASRGLWRNLVSFYAPLMPQLLQAVRRCRPDLIHVNNDPGVAWPAVILAGLLRIPLVCHLRTARALKPAELRLLRWVDALIVLSRASEAQCRAQGVPPSKMAYIPNGIDVEGFARNGHRQAARAALGLPPDGPVIGVVSRLIPGKGHEAFLHALRIVADAQPDVRAVILGDACEGSSDHPAQLKRLAEALGLSRHVQFVGWSDEPIGLYPAFDVLAQTSLLDEGLPGVAIEAMAWRLPVISTAVGGARDIVEDGVTGTLVPPHDPQAMAGALLDLLRDAARMHRMGEAGYQRALAQFDIRRTADAIRALYQRVSGRAAARAAATASAPAILTTYAIPQSEAWTRATFALGPQPGRGLLGWLHRGLAPLGIRDLTLPIRLLRLREHYDVLITGAEREDCLFAVLQALLPGRRIPHLMMCCLWKREANPLRYWIKRALIRLMSRSVTRFIVWSREEIDHYGRCFGIERGRFVFTPHHATLDGYPVTLSEGDYLFAGGDSSRDYGTLIEAVRPLRVPLVIATIRPERWRALAAGAPHIRIASVSPQRFRELMAGARAVVVPLEPGMLQAAGHQTYLNAMQLHKPVIVSDAPGVRDHLVDGETGWIVPAGDPAALRRAIRQVVGGGSRVERVIAAAAASVVDRFTLEHFVERNLTLARLHARRDA
jgi:glycosyltransferase involved in cell wall biosynthesis